MLKNKFFPTLVVGMLYSLPVMAFSPPDNLNTPYTTNIELKSTSFIDMSRSYKTAAICFLGHGDCDPNIGFGKGDDYEVVTDDRCTNEGFYKNNCSSVQVPTGYCPYNSSYINGCKCDPTLVSCGNGYVGVGTACGGKYRSCKCVDCSAYKFTYAQATAAGYVTNGSCLSCTTTTYKRACANCSGYDYTYAQATADGYLANGSCKTCETTKYKRKCKDCSAYKFTYAEVTAYGYTNEGSCKSCETTTYKRGCADCSSYPLTTCPSKGTCSSCTSCTTKKYKLTSCDSGYSISGNSCVPTCDLRTAVSCPQGCASNYSDCSTKCQKCKVISCNTPKANVDNFLTSSTYTTIGGKSIYNYGTPNGIGCFRGRATTALAMLGLHGWNCSSCTAQSENGTQTSGYNCTCVASTTYPNASKTTGANGSARDTMCGGVVIVCPNAGCKSGYTYSGGGCVENTCGSEYSLSSCPSNGNCSSCKSGSSTKYKLDSCNSGYSKSGSSCIKDAPACNYTDTCSGYTVTSAGLCADGATSCTACGTTKYKCKPNTKPVLLRCVAPMQTIVCNGATCCCPQGIGCDMNYQCDCQKTEVNDSCPGGAAGSSCSCGGTHSKYQAGQHYC